MINQDKWINSLPKISIGANKTINQLYNDRWTNTIAKKHTFNNSVKKYSLMTVLLIFGLFFVSMVKNETRNLQKEINIIKASINVIKFNLDQANLDNEVITSPENISLLAKEHLNINLVSYKHSQIKHLNNKVTKFVLTKELKNEAINKKKIKKLPESIKAQVAQRIEKKKTEIKKLQEIYSNPKKLPQEIKKEVAYRIEQKKSELKNLYNAPKEIITFERAQKWVVVQVAKLFLGIPVVPGR